MFFISHETLAKYIRSEVTHIISETIRMRWHVRHELRKLMDEQALEKAWEVVINDPKFTEAMVENINKYQLK